MQSSSEKAYFTNKKSFVDQIDAFTSEFTFFILANEYGQIK